LLTLLSVAALVACAASAVAVVAGGAWLQGALSSPTSTAQSFYGALQQSDYSAAYKYFSSGAQAHLSEAAFADQFGAYDAIDGAVVQIALGQPTYTQQGAVALVTVRVTRAERGARLQANQLRLVKDQGQWRIASISLQFELAPTPTTMR
jgi:hypothetical protein